MTMIEDKSHSRREFLKKFAYLSATGSALLLTACSMPKYGAPPVVEESYKKLDAAGKELPTAQEPYLRPQARYGVQAVRPFRKIDNLEDSDK